MLSIIIFIVGGKILIHQNFLIILSYKNFNLTIIAHFVDFLLIEGLHLIFIIEIYIVYLYSIMIFKHNFSPNVRNNDMFYNDLH